MKLSLLVFLGLACAAFAKTTQSWSGKGDIIFDGTSTLHAWGGKVSAKPYATEVTLDAAADQIAADGKTPAKLPMTLTLLGKPQQVLATITNWKLTRGKATFDLDFPISMKASGISVPVLLLFIKVGDGIKVHAAITLTQN
jgi:hypothetical protein